MSITTEQSVGPPPSAATELCLFGVKELLSCAYLGSKRVLSCAYLGSKRVLSCAYLGSKSY